MENEINISICDEAIKEINGDIETYTCREDNKPCRRQCEIEYD